MADGAPATYDDVSQIYINPWALWHEGYTNIPNFLKVIADHWMKIGALWDPANPDSLKLGWAGDTADAVEDFNKRLMDVQARLFGVAAQKEGDEDEPGLVEQACKIMMIASLNYQSAEDAILNMFRGFGDAIYATPLPPEVTDDSGGDTTDPLDGQTAPASITSHDSPVTESFPV